MKIWWFLNSNFSMWFFPTVIIGLVIYWTSDVTQCASVRDADLLGRVHLAKDIGWTGRGFLDDVRLASDVPSLRNAWKQLHYLKDKRPDGTLFSEDKDKLFGELLEELRINANRWGYNPQLDNVFAFADAVNDVNDAIGTPSDESLSKSIVEIRKRAISALERFPDEKSSIYEPQVSDRVRCWGPWNDYRKLDNSVKNGPAQKS